MFVFVCRPLKIFLSDLAQRKTQLCTTTYYILTMEPQRNRRVPRVLMVQPPTNDVELKVLDTLTIRHIIIYTSKAAPLNSTLFHLEYLQTLLNQNNHLYDQHQQWLVHIQQACLLQWQQQQQQQQQQQPPQEQLQERPQEQPMEQL